MRREKKKIMLKYMYVCLYVNKVGLFWFLRNEFLVQVYFYKDYLQYNNGKWIRFCNK